MQCNNIVSKNVGVAAEACIKCRFNEPVNYCEVCLVLMYITFCREYPRLAKI